MTVVVGHVDGPVGDAALERGIAETRLRGGKLVVVRSMVGKSHEAAEEYVAAAEAMEAAHETLHAVGIDHCTHEYVRGNTPAEDIVAAAIDHDAELIVLGIRRRSAAGKLLLGSTALDVLAESPVPVLCVKATGS